jgi:hypothetical protein
VDADARRSHAVARLAKWSDRAGRGWVHGWVAGRPNPLVRFAENRVAAAVDGVERVARADVRAGVDPDHVSFRIPTNVNRAAATIDAIAYYARAADILVADLAGRAGGGEAGEAGEAVPGPGEGPTVREDRGR